MKTKISLMLVVVLALLSGCNQPASEVTPEPTVNNVETPIALNSTLTVTGDVLNEISIDGFSGYEVLEIEVDEEKLPSIGVLDLLENAQLIGSETSLVFYAPDGVMARIELDQIDETCRLTLSQEEGWKLRSSNHPPQAGIRNIEYIVAVSEVVGQEQPCLRVIEGEGETTISFGSLFMQEGIVKSVLDGSAQKLEYSVDAYVKRELVPISNYVTGGSTALGYFADGSQVQIELDGFFEWRGNSADYIAPDAKTRLAGIIGVWVDAPEKSIMDIPADIDAYAGNTMVIHIDGLGYAMTQKHAPSLAEKNTVLPARTVMPSISNVSLAAMVTGVRPDVNGVAQRDDRELLVEDMFVGKDAAMVEGYSKLITTSCEQQLNADENANGSTDDEVFASAMEAVQENHEITFIHFHGVDDYAHTYGPNSTEVGKKVAEIDGYVSELVENFKGQVIITSDHGQHDVEDTQNEKMGDHGEFRYEDMAVPYIVFEVN